MNKILLITLLIGFLSQPGLVYALDQDKVAIETILLESRGESYIGQVAVGEVIRNRSKQGQGSINDVCLAPYQFSCWNNLKVAEKALKGVSGEEFQIASKAWNESEDTTYSNGATHYLAKKRLKHLPGWLKAMEETGIIGNHTIYRE